MELQIGKLYVWNRKDKLPLFCTDSITHKMVAPIPVGEPFIGCIRFGEFIVVLAPLMENPIGWSPGFMTLVLFQDIMGYTITNALKERCRCCEGQ